MHNTLPIAVASICILSCMGDVNAQIIPRIRYTRPCLTNGIPTANYATSKRSRSARVLSLPAIASDPVDTTNQPNDTIATSTPEEPEFVPPPPTPTLAEELRIGTAASTSIAELISSRTSLGIDTFSQFDPLRRRDLRANEQTKVFAFKPDSLSIDHCRVSEVSVHLQSNGDLDSKSAR